MQEGFLASAQAPGVLKAQAAVGLIPVFPQISDLPSVVLSSVSFAMLFSVGVAVFLFIKSGETPGSRMGIWLFSLQLILGLIWLGLLFFLRLPGWIFAVVLLQWLLLLQTVVIFWRRLAVAGLLLLPYFIWVSIMLWLLAARWI